MKSRRSQFTRRVGVGGEHPSVAVGLACDERLAVREHDVFDQLECLGSSGLGDQDVGGGDVDDEP